MLPLQLKKKKTYRLSTLWNNTAILLRELREKWILYAAFIEYFFGDNFFYILLWHYSWTFRFWFIIRGHFLFDSLFIITLCFPLQKQSTYLPLSNYQAASTMYQVYEVHFKSNAHSGMKPTQCALKKITSTFSVVSQTCQYTICYSAVRTCVYTVCRT